MSASSRTHANRRRFLKQIGALSAASALPSTGLFASAPDSSAAPFPQAAALHPATRNRAPLQPNAFHSLPLGSVKPTGWLRTQLEIQANGLSGYLDETWPDVGPNSGWLGGTGESWERGPYYLDGLIPLAWLLDDARLKAKAQRYIEWTLQSQSSSGIFGPTTNDDWWPRMVMLKALTQYYELTLDQRALNLIQRYCSYQLAELPKRPLRDWGKFRWQDNTLTVLWLYNRTGDPKLLDLARLLHQQGFNWVGDFADFQYQDRITPEFIKLSEGEGLKDLALATHGVNNGQAIKTGPVWSLVSASETDRLGAAHMISELDKYHGLPNGMFSCDEHFAGRNPSQGSELCTVVEYMFSLEQAIAITGSPALADRLERLAYNALPGTLSDDMWSHQYNQEPNQVECSLHHKPWTTDGPESNLFGLEPHFGCCTANYHQGWPKFAASLFMHSAHNEKEGLAAIAYAPCELHTVLGMTNIHLVEETSYPFKGQIRITINPASPLAFPMSLRIPEWANGATIKVNGKFQPTPSTGSFAQLDRTWSKGDQVEIDFPMTSRTSKGFNNSVAVDRGPLVFSYGIGEDWLKLRDRGMTADWQIYPTTAWNYALDFNAAENAAITVTESEIGPIPFSGKSSPVELHLQARKLPAWQAEDGVANPLPLSPVKSTEPLETITLLPYAAAKLRITSFPWVESDQTPPKSA